ncbi:restriction endonuclease, SacI family [Pseudoclavibacter helvolus]|uniref:restriction endonuclease, SacI family n=1 Tax=Pseudoclavibacter helvolus TaxID=255205 RepID=UPI003734F0DC
MTAFIDKKLAESEALRAVSRAKSDERLPVEWSSHAQTIFSLESKTFTPALGTLLLARAVNADVDVMAIKASGDRAYSMRGLGHSVLVPAAVKHGFSIRNTGREPLNNQPFFRYDRIDQILRVRSQRDFDYFIDVVRRADLLSSEAAAEALAAFIRVAFEEADRVKSIRVKSSGLTSSGAVIAAEDFLRHDAPDRPRRLQAFVAACLDLTHTDVRSRKINDPSRDLPGDVHAFNADEVVLSIEVRGKAVTVEDVASYVEACEASGVRRMAIFVDAVGQSEIDIDQVESPALRSGELNFVLYSSVEQLIRYALFWSETSITLAGPLLAARVLERLAEIEVSESTLKEWTRAVAIARAGR